MNKIGLLVVSITMILQVVGCSYEEKYISNYEKYGSNTISEFSVDAKYLIEEDSKCVTRSVSKSIDFLLLLIKK